MDGSKAGMSHREREGEMMIYWAWKNPKFLGGAKEQKELLQYQKQDRLQQMMPHKILNKRIQVWK